MAKRARVSGARLHGLLNAELIHRDPSCDASFAPPKRIAPTQGDCNWDVRVIQIQGEKPSARCEALVEEIVAEFKQRYELR